jgi:hypothetical protein
MIAMLLGSGCDQKPSVAAHDAAPVTSVTSTASAAPEPPKPPVVTIDDASFVVAGDKVDFGKTAGGASGDVKGRIVGLLAAKPLVAGQTLEVDALRDTTMPHFSIAIDALREAKVKAANVRTAKRDRTVATLHVTLEHPPPPSCTAVAMIAKDNAVLVWPYGGAIAQRFSHGFAGPDITLGSGALAKLANQCSAPFDLVSADDSIKWGVVFDLALAAAESPGFRPTSTDVLAKVPVPGRKVSE